MPRNKISFAYVSPIIDGMAVNHNPLPRMWWENVDPNIRHIIGLTLGVVLDRGKSVTVSVEIQHEDSDKSCIDESEKGLSQADHFVGYTDVSQEFLGISTLHIGGVLLNKLGMYIVTVKIHQDFDDLHELKTYFYVSSVKEPLNG